MIPLFRPDHHIPCISVKEHFFPARMFSHVTLRTRRVESSSWFPLTSFIFCTFFTAFLLRSAPEIVLAVEKKKKMSKHSSFGNVNIVSGMRAGLSFATADEINETVGILFMVLSFIRSSTQVASRYVGECGNRKALHHEKTSALMFQAVSACQLCPLEIWVMSKWRDLFSQTKDFFIYRAS